MKPTILAVLLLACTASAQIFEGVIMLPDTLGPMYGPFFLAWDTSSAHPRLYIGSETGDVIVADAHSYKRLARFTVGPMNDMCFCPQHNRLYVAKKDRDSVAVVDCATYQVVATFPVSTNRPKLFHNPVNDRLYCGGNPVIVFDCAQGAVVRTVAAMALSFAFDPYENRLYCGTYGAVSAIDCEGDSVVAVIDQVRGANSLLYCNPVAKKLYTFVTDTLIIVDIRAESVVARLRMVGLLGTGDFNPRVNRFYCASVGAPCFIYAVDGVGDTVIYKEISYGVPFRLICDSLRDRVYLSEDWGVRAYDGATGAVTSFSRVDGRGPKTIYSPELDRVFSVPDSWRISAIDCAAESVVGGVPLVGYAGRLCVDTTLNKLYFLAGNRAIGVVDCSRNIVTKYMWETEYPLQIMHNPASRKLYVNSVVDSSVVVYDCTADTVLRSIYIGGNVLALLWEPKRNKVYAVEQHRDPNGYGVAVIGCDVDSVVARIALPFYFPSKQLLVPESDRLWSLHDAGFTIIDTKYDVIVTDTVTSGWHNLIDACAAPADRKIYRSGRDYLYSVDMDSIAHIESIARSSVAQWQYLHYAENQHKLFWSDRIVFGDPDSVYVINTEADSLVAKFLGASSTIGMCSDRTGNFVYCLGSTDTLLYVVDVRADSVINCLRVPRNLQDFAHNQRTHRIYCEPYWLGSGGIPVIFDSVDVGLAEVAAEPASGAPCATMVNRSVSLRVTASSEFYDASGRRVAVLRPGANDVRALAPGVYFVREEPQAPSLKPQAARKVVITR